MLRSQFSGTGNVVNSPRAKKTAVNFEQENSKKPKKRGSMIESSEEGVSSPAPKPILYKVKIEPREKLETDFAKDTIEKTENLLKSAIDNKQKLTSSGKKTLI